jgi:hypothetical protein
MPSLTHEALVMLFRDNPELAVAFARAVSEHPLPDGAARISSAEIADLQPAEYRADLVLCLEDPPGEVVHVLVVEVQLERDANKRFAWPLYVANLRGRYKCNASLLVITLDERVRRWFAEEVDYGQVHDEYTPRVLGPELIPVITDAARAKAEPALAVLSAAAHGKEPGAERIALAALQGCVDLDNEVATLYADLVQAFLGRAAQAALEAILNTGSYQFQSEFARKYVQLGREEGERRGREEGERRGLERGREEGERQGLERGMERGRERGREERSVQAIFAVLEAKSIAVSEQHRARILTCRDLDLLDAWLRRAAVADSIADVFGAE